MIAKTRQATVEIEERFDPEVGKARGVLRREFQAGKLRHSRRAPSHEVAPFIMHYWFIDWDLRGCEPQLVENVPHPNVHLIFDAGEAVVSGVQTGKFTRVLSGQARVVGVKFRCGGFRSFIDDPVSTLINRTQPAQEIFGNDFAAFESKVFTSEEEDELVRAANAFFESRKANVDPNAELAGGLVDLILQNTEIKSVDDLAHRANVHKRSLQRIFTEYVGVSPKWVIRRYRLHELIERIHSGEPVDWAQTAVELGYFDQAHMANDFKSIVGYSPTDYRKQAPK